jgi:hypothetical protein
MNERIRELADEAAKFSAIMALPTGESGDNLFVEKFAELIKQAIYNDVKEELIPDELINIEPDSLAREYLKGCNGGTVDALCHIKNFGVDIEL